MIVIAGNYVGRLATGDGSRSKWRPRRGFPKRRRTLARRWFHDDHDGYADLGRRAIWAMRSERQTTNTPLGAFGKPGALSSLRKSAGADRGDGRFEGGVPLVQLRRRDLRGHCGAALGANASASAGHVSGSQRHHGTGLRHPAADCRDGGDWQWRGLGVPAAFGVGGGGGGRRGDRLGGTEDSLSQAQAEEGEYKPTPGTRAGIASCGGR